MQFIVDESTGVAVVKYLRSQGYDVLAVAETMLQADDAAILERAVLEDRILITNDKDFGELVFRSKKPHHGVILLRLQDESSANRVHKVQVVLQKYGNRLANNFTVVTEQTIRFRSTP